MTTTLTPMTELEALNDMLSVIGESPVASLDDASDVPDAQSALSILRRVARAVQEKGWHWNTEENYTLSPDTTSTIYLPQNTLDVDPSDQTIDYVSRAGKLYDRTNHTFAITNPVNVDIVLQLDFEDLPSQARKYICCLAGKIFQARAEGDPNLNAEEEKEVIAAWADLLQSECDNAGYNVMQDAPTLSNRRRWRTVSE